MKRARINTDDIYQYGVTAEDWKFVAECLLPDGDYKAILRAVVARAVRRNLRNSKVEAARRRGPR